MGYAMRAFSPTRFALILGVIAISFASLTWAQRTISVNDIVDRMAEAQRQNRERFVPYTVTRQYQLGSAGAERPTSSVVAEVSAIAPSEEEYVISQTAGSDRGEKIVRKVLDHETQIEIHPGDYAVSARNYDFSLIGTDSLNGRNCYVLELHPKRDSSDLVRGRIWVDANQYVIRKIDGEPAKSPSFWLKNVHFTVSFGEVQGIWMQTETRAVANVRLLGEHVLTSRYVDLQRASVTAANRPSQTMPSRNSARQRAIANSATFVSR